MAIVRPHRVIGPHRAGVGAPGPRPRRRFGLRLSLRYHLATREMRFVLESFVHAICIDKIYESLSLKEKLEELKSLERNRDKRFWNKDRLFKKTFPKHTTAKKLGKEMYKFYQELCGKVHPSYEELSHLRRYIVEHGEEFSMGGLYDYYNKEYLIESLKSLKKLHNYVIKILDCF